MMIQRLLRLSAALFCLVATACAAPQGNQPAAQSAAPARGRTVQKIIDRGVLRVALSGEQPPYNFVDRAGELQGMDVDLARALAESMEVKVEFVKKPFAEILPAVEAGEADLALSGVTMTMKRNTQVAFVGPYFASGKSILTKNEILSNAKESSEINDANFRLVALAGSTSEKFVKEVAGNAAFTPVADYETGVTMVVAGEADALIADLPICVLSVFLNPNQGLAALATPLTFEPMGVVLPSDDAHFENLVENYIRLLEGTGLLEELRAKWFGGSAWVNLLPAGKLKPSPNVTGGVSL